MDLKSIWQNKPNWKTLLRKSLPYVLVAVFSYATVFAVLGVQSNEKQYSTVSGTKAELENQKQELEAALSQSQSLLNQLNSINSDTQTLLQKAQTSEDAVADKLDQLQQTLENAENQEQQRWVLPIQYKLCTSWFGYRDHPIAGEAKFHYGVDLAADHGVPIVAARSGTVTTAAYQEGNAGYYVVIDHLDGYDSRYMHMSKYIVAEGQFVMAGQIIGYCGATGAATGNHLHFGIYHNNEAVNPADYIDLY